ncbi:unnamed protein product [Toxocara canis]|uniref:Ricin B-type lectin domain-containing protein n=1 Tax=Toxocara canis TaxID=6265 RepID=A0A183UUW0_TOXCA|nr:unnamed protein product [Toxocara canis]
MYTSVAKWNQIIVLTENGTEEEEQCLWKIQISPNGSSIFKQISPNGSSIFNTTVLPAMLYARETWATTKVAEEKFTITDRAVERQMCSVARKDRIKNDGSRCMAGVKDVVTEMYRSKRCWAGHVARMSGNRWTYRLTQWTPREAKRPLGRPKTR